MLAPPPLYLVEVYSKWRTCIALYSYLLLLTLNLSLTIVINCWTQAGASEHARTLGPKGSDPHKAAVIGDTIGDPLKDTSGPSLNILIKLMAVESLVFAPFFATHGGILFKLF